MLLGENNLICVSDTGKMKFVKKLDYTPLSFCKFFHKNKSSESIFLKVIKYLSGSFVVGWYFGELRFRNKD